MNRRDFFKTMAAVTALAAAPKAVAAAVKEISAPIVPVPEDYWTRSVVMELVFQEAYGGQELVTVSCDSMQIEYGTPLFDFGFGGPKYRTPPKLSFKGAILKDVSNSMKWFAIQATSLQNKAGHAFVRDGDSKIKYFEIYHPHLRYWSSEMRFDGEHPPTFELSTDFDRIELTDAWFEQNKLVRVS